MSAQATPQVPAQKTALPPGAFKALVENFSALKTDATVAAKQAGLRYVNDRSPGIQRVSVLKQGKPAFRYLAADGKRLSGKASEALLARIKSLVIPPAWTDVWICPWENGHIQVTARDARGRKQYRYHPQWRAVRDEAKYGHLLQFGPALPLIRDAIHKALAKPGLSREKVLAAVISLLESTHIRVGNEEYARSNNSFGLTTLKNRHVQIKGTSIAFEFRGKSGVKHAVSLRDARLSRIIRHMRELPGQELFQYLDEDGNRHAIDSSDVNDYLRNIAGDSYTAKDFRTWSGTLYAARALQELGPAESDAEAKKNIVNAIAQVAKKLGNTPAICRKCYVHPDVLQAYMEGRLCDEWKACASVAANSPTSLQKEEAILLKFLALRLRQGHN